MERFREGGEWLKSLAALSVGKKEKGNDFSGKQHLLGTETTPGGGQDLIYRPSRKRGGCKNIWAPGEREKKEGGEKGVTVSPGEFGKGERNHEKFTSPSPLILRKGKKKEKEGNPKNTPGTGKKKEGKRGETSYSLLLKGGKK